MFKNYLKIAWRNLKKNRLYASVNIIGLTVGIVSCLLIGIYIREELSYDRFNLNADKLVRVTMDYSHGGYASKVAVTGTKIGPQFKRTFPEVADYVRLMKYATVVKQGDQSFKENDVLYADPSLLKMFSFPMAQGNAAQQLTDPNKIIITQTIAAKYFNTEDPIGKTLQLDGKSYMVSAIAMDAPTNSQIQFDFIVPFSNLNAAKKPEQWWSANYTTYLLLKNENQIKSLQNGIASYMKGISRDELKMSGKEYLTYHLEPLTSVHLHSELPNGLEPNGSILYVYILVVVAALILIIACVNYINLSIAQSAGRGGEIGIRKVLGAARVQLFKQFISESLVVTAIALILGIFAVYVLLPYFNQLSGKQLRFDMIYDPVIIGFIILIGISIGFAAGAYPALLLSNIKLSKILKSGFSFTSGQSIRRSLIVFQFVISIFLIVTTVIILQQLSYIRNKDVGYNKSNVLVLQLDYKMLNQMDALKKATRNIAGVENTAAANSEPVDIKWGDMITTADGNKLTVAGLPMDEDFIKTMQLKLASGRDFNQTDLLQMDTSNNMKNYRSAYMLNESAVRALGWTPKEAIGKVITRGTPGRVVAVVKDFNFKSFHDAISPLVIFLDHDESTNLFVRISGNNTAAAIQNIQALWKERVPSIPFEYRFLDNDYDALYRTEQRTAGIFSTFSALAIVLACLGLFAITAYAVVQRTKEIGIRKVMGANVSSIILLISKDFLWMVIIAAAVATPLSWYVAHKWLQDFAYRIEIHWWIFAAAGMVSLIVAGATVSIQALKAAMVNPIKSLKSE